MDSSKHFASPTLDKEGGRLSFVSNTLDFDNAAEHLTAFCQLIDASVKDCQTDADLVSWLIDFEGVDFMLRAEHYSASIWLERLGAEGEEEMIFLQYWLSKHVVK